MSPAAPAAVPRHVAIIMDGNGRWARQRGLSRLHGHREGVESVRAIVRACRPAGVKYLTLYAFSTENWARPAAEVKGLMRILVTFLRSQDRELHENRVRLRTIGEPDAFPASVRRELDRVKQETAHYRDGTLILALNYGGRAELVRAARALVAEARQGRLREAEVDEKRLAAGLDAPDIPDPDLLIRTSGEKRLSNFLLWQLSYAEFYFTDVLWPDFREPQFQEALAEYARRHRRFGGLG
jgi:undecaprenyl diphosphate synthase